MENMNEAITPEVIEEGKKKIYGTSVIDQVDESIDDGMVAPEYSAEEIETMRQDLVNSDGPNARVVDRVSTDALSGTIIASRENASGETDLDDLDAELEKKDIRGKTLPDKAINLINQLIGVKYTDEDAERLAKYFEKYFSSELTSDDFTFSKAPYGDIVSALGKDVMETIVAISDDPDEGESITRRFISQIYSTYSTAVEYNDDMRELTRLTRKVKETSDQYKLTKGELENNPELINDPDYNARTLDDLYQAQEWITKWLSQRSKLDRRNQHLKQDYSIDDIDTKTVEEIKVALEDALSMKLIYEYIDSQVTDTLRKQFFNIKDRNEIIKHWIKGIKNDPDTLYTFPTNDYYSIEKTREDVVEFIYNALIAEHYSHCPVPEDWRGEIGEYYIKNKVATEDEIHALKVQGYMILYILAKTFKHKKLRTEYMRRVMSYTLDMMSKLGKVAYRTKFCELGDYIYNLLYKKQYKVDKR